MKDYITFIYKEKCINPFFRHDGIQKVRYDTFMFFKLLKFIFNAFVFVLVLISLYIGYLYIQNPTVVSRIASMMMGEATGELEIVKANEAFALNIFLYFQ